MKDFLALNFSKYFKSTREKSFSKLSEEQNIRKCPESLYTLPTTPDEAEKYVEIMQSNFSNKYVDGYNIEILNLFDPELQLINTKTVIKNKLKVIPNKFLGYKSNDFKIFHSSTKLIASDSDTDKASKSMHQSIMTKIKNYASKD